MENTFEQALNDLAIRETVRQIVEAKQLQAQIEWEGEYLQQQQ